MTKLELLISNLNHFCAGLESPKLLMEPKSVERLTQFVHQAGVELEDLPFTPTFSDSTYLRTIIHASSYYEMKLFTWRPGQCSPIHNHCGSACIMRIMSGTLTEIVFEHSQNGMLFPVKTEHRSAGAISGAVDADIHQIVNLQQEDLVSLHVYAPPLNGMQVLGLESTPFGDYQRHIENSARQPLVAPSIRLPLIESPHYSQPHL